MKQEPEDYPWSALAKDGGTAWTGVRNYLARNHLRAMKRGDLVLYYHSGERREVVGLARVAREAYPDPTASPEDGDWSCMDLVPVQPLKSPVSLAACKADPILCETHLVRMSRLSVMPLSPAQFGRVLELGQTTLAP